jgi:hypothetical protein
MNARLIRGASGPGARRLAWQNMAPLQLAVLPYFAGAALLLAGVEDALHALAVGMILCLVKAALDSWVLLVEINR